MKIVPALAGLALAVLATPAAAQVAPWAQPWGSSVDRDRYERDRLRYEADRRAAEAARNQAETQRRLYEVEAARQPALPADPGVRPLRSPQEERAAREAATTRRREAVAGTTQIDAWLDRTPRP